MKSKVLIALELVAELSKDRDGAPISELRTELLKKGIGWDPKLIGVLCSSSPSPFCKMKGVSLVITESGMKALEHLKIEDGVSEEPEPEPEPVKPTPKKPKREPIEIGFIETNQEIDIVRSSIDDNKNILLYGPTGCGKSYLIEELARVYERKLITVSCDAELDKMEIIGQKEIITDDKGNSVTNWINGPLLQCMINGWWLCLDEVNVVRPDIEVVLNRVMDDRRAITVKENKMEEIKAHPDFRIFGTMNPEYAGTTEMNYSLRRRFQRIVPMDYLSRSEEIKLLQKRTGIDFATAEKCVNIGVDTRSLQKERKISYPVSTAHLLEFAQMLAEKEFTPLQCARITLNISETESENQDVLNVVRSYF